MERAAAPLESRPRHRAPRRRRPVDRVRLPSRRRRFVVGSRATGCATQPADQDLVLALAIAYFAEAFDEAPPDLEATQSDLSALVRHLAGAEADPARRALLGEAMDAIDDGLAGDAVAGKLQAARSPRDDAVDPVELLSRRAREIVAGG